MTNTRELRLTVPAEPKSVHYVRGVLDDFCRARQIDDETLHDLKVALSEACTNVVRHAYEGRTGPLDVAIVIERDKVAFTVCDEGRGSRQAHWIKKRGLRRRTAHAGGHGTLIMRALVDEMSYATPARGTALRLVKYLS